MSFLLAHEVPIPESVFARSNLAAGHTYPLARR